MNKCIAIVLVLTIGLSSCKNSDSEQDKLEIAKNYFKALNSSNSSEMKAVLSDSLRAVIPEYDYEVKFSKRDYIENWLKWDAVFEPTYTVLDMELVDGMVKAKISKTDKRILFFMGKAFLTNETLKFENEKITTVETQYLNFDEATWDRNKNALLNWSEKQHPELELNRFIYDQTESGGKKLLKAIEGYKNKE